jgi:hypothetical protein
MSSKHNFREIGAALVALADSGVNPLAIAPVTGLAAAIVGRLDDLSVDTPIEDLKALIALVEALEAAMDKLALAVAPVTAISTVADLAVA